MGIRFTCPSGHKLNVKSHLAGKRGVCPQCGEKFTIPLEEEPQRVEAVPATGTSRIDSVQASQDHVGTPTDVGSQSIIIPVAETSVTIAPAVNGPIVNAPPIAGAPVVNTSVIVSPTMVTNPPPLANGPAAPPVELEPVASAQPFLAPSTIEPASPAALYVAKRARSRRNQFAVAAILLVAVFVLAGVLIWVLQHGSATSPTENAAPTSLYDSPASPYFAISAERRFNAHSAHGAT